MLLSPSSRAPSTVASTDFTHYQHGSQFTMFLTAPVQAFCFLIGISNMNIDKVSPHSHYIQVHLLSTESFSCSDANLCSIFQDAYDKAEQLFSLSLSEWEAALMVSDSLHPVWVEFLGDPFLRRLILRFLTIKIVYHFKH